MEAMDPSLPHFSLVHDPIDPNNIRQISIKRNELIQNMSSKNSQWENALQSFKYGLDSPNLAIDKPASSFNGQEDGHLKHWHSNRLLHDFSFVFPRQEPLNDWQKNRVLRQKQLYSRYLEKHSQGLSLGTFSQRDSLILHKTTKSDKTFTTKKGKISNSQLVKNRVQEALEKKNFESAEKKISNLFQKANTLGVEEACKFLEDSISDGSDVPPTLMIKLYLLLIDFRKKLVGTCRLSDLDRCDSNNVASFVGLYLAIRDLERLYSKLLDEKNYIYISEILESMGLFDFAAQIRQQGNIRPSTSKKPTKQAISYAEFQIKYASDYIIRDVGSAHDDRVSFIPDKWQIDMLNAVDSRTSLLVSAPTSSGKTFVSYYAIGKILKENKAKNAKKGRSVFVLPTKALVNQTSAEIYKRFGNIFAVFTRDQKDGNYETADILICVPQTLEILLFSPTSQKWIKSIKYAIIDEIHNIGLLNDGAIWERVIVMLQCPIICLSATIGNFEEFSTWLESILEMKGQRLCKIKHFFRWNDTRMWIYAPGSSRSLPGTDRWQLG